MQTMDMAGTISRLSARVPTDGNVYPGEDGLLYCRRCHTPKQKRITVGGTALTVCCLCRCMTEQRDQEAAELKKREEMQRVRRYREAGFSSRELRDCTFAADDGARPETTAAMVAYAKKYCANIEFSAEDATRSDPAFLAKVVEAAIRNGATTVNIPDTVGYTTPGEMRALIEYLRANVENSDRADFSVHCHNDLGMATANSLAAVKAGATQVECTVNGIGERAGNTALEEVVMALYTRKNFFDAECGVDTTQIFKSSKLLSMITGVKVQPNKAIVGENAFAHEAGIHQHGVLANKKTYEIMTPESIGLSENKMVLGKHSGKHALSDRLRSLGLTVTDEALAEIFDEFKKLADRQKSVSDRDIEALVHKKSVSVPESYKLDRFVINVGNTITTTSAVKLDCPDGQKREVVTSSAFGPIDASYKAINDIVGGESFELVDFLIDSVTGGTDAQGAVTVKIKSEGNVYNGHAVSLDIVNAAVMAYVSAINNMIYDKNLVKGGNN